MPELTLIVGHVGAGKSTRARVLESETGALRLTPDEWMMPLFGQPESDGMRDVVEGRLIWTATRALTAGAAVILDFGFWGREERAALHWLARSVGAIARTEYVAVDRETQAARVARRWSEQPHTTWQVTQDELDEWRAMLQEPDAAELAGRVTAPEPPEGWAAWIATRWPTALG